MQTGTLAERKKKKTEKGPVELTDDEKFVLKLQQDVNEYMNIWRAASLNYPRLIVRHLDERSVVGGGDAYDADTGNTPLILAARNDHLKCVELLITGSASSSSSSTSTTTSSTGTSSSSSSANSVMRASVNLAGFGGMTALHHAAKNDCLSVLSYLLEETKLNLEAPDDAGNTPVSLAARAGNLKCIELLANKGANIDHTNKNGCSPLMIAVLHSRAAIVDFFIKRSININAVDNNGNSALHYAARCGYSRLVRVLLLAGIKPSLENNEGETAADVAQNEVIRNMIKSYGELP